jgi:quercetin dioxygenase-like cupin family protein
MTTFEEFIAVERERGADEVLVREWAPMHTTPVHDHPFDTRARVVRGSLRLIIDGQERLLQAGDEFELARHVAHAEQYGSEGATFWAARRN